MSIWDPDKPPSCGITQLNNFYEKVREALVNSKYFGKPLNSLVASYDLSTITQKALAKTKHWTFEQTEAIRSIILHYHTETLTAEVVDRIARTVAGWKNEIEEGTLYKVWTPTMGPVWATIFIEDVRPALSKNKQRFTCTLWSLSGPTVNFVWRKVFPASFCRKILYECGGDRSEAYVPEDVGGLWITATIRFSDSFLKYELIHASATQREQNKRLLYLRKQKCGLEKYRGKPCFPCEFGRTDCTRARQNITMPISVCINPYPYPHNGAIQLRGLCKECIKRGSGYYFLKKDVNTK